MKHNTPATYHSNARQVEESYSENEEFLEEALEAQLDQPRNNPEQAYAAAYNEFVSQQCEDYESEALASESETIESEGVCPSEDECKTPSRNAPTAALAAQSRKRKRSAPLPSASSTQSAATPVFARTPLTPASTLELAGSN